MVICYYRILESEKKRANYFEVLFSRTFLILSLSAVFSSSVSFLFGGCFSNHRFNCGFSSLSGSNPTIALPILQLRFNISKVKYLSVSGVLLAIFRCTLTQSGTERFEHMSSSGYQMPCFKLM